MGDGPAHPSHGHAHSDCHTRPMLTHHDHSTDAARLLMFLSDALDPSAANPTQPRSTPRWLPPTALNGTRRPALQSRRRRPTIPLSQRWPRHFCTGLRSEIRASAARGQGLAPVCFPSRRAAGTQTFSPGAPTVSPQQTVPPCGIPAAAVSALWAVGQFRRVGIQVWRDLIDSLLSHKEGAAGKRPGGNRMTPHRSAACPALMSFRRIGSDAESGPRSDNPF